MLRITNVISRENRGKRVLCGNGTLPPFAVPHVELHRRQKHFAEHPEQAWPLYAKGEGGWDHMKFQRHVAHREQGKYHIFDPLASSLLSPEERRAIQHPPGLANERRFLDSHCHHQGPKIEPGNVIFNGRPITIFLTSYVRA